MSEDIIHFGRATDNANAMSPKDTLEDAMDCIGKHGALEKGKKLMIIALDDTEGCFNVSWFQCGMKMSECIALCEAAKMKFFEEMGY